jgi:ATP-dependent DNA helicase RecQ
MYEYDKALNEDSILRELISWAFNHFVYQRLQSVRNIYETCQEYKDSEQFMDVIVRYLAREEENETLLTNPADYKVWFKLLKEKPMIELKSIIARYLESDDKLVSLNFISGIIRLLTDDYDNADGERRLKMAFEEISRFATNEITEIVREMFNVIPKDKYKDVVVKSILEVDENFAEYLYKEYQNEEIESHIIYNIASKIRDVGGKINDKYRKN